MASHDLRESRAMFQIAPLSSRSIGTFTSQTNEGPERARRNTAARHVFRFSRTTDFNEVQKEGASEKVTLGKRFRCEVVQSRELLLEVDSVGINLVVTEWPATFAAPAIVQTDCLDLINPRLEAERVDAIRASVIGQLVQNRFA